MRASRILRRAAVGRALSAAPPAFRPAPASFAAAAAALAVLPAPASSWRGAGAAALFVGVAASVAALPAVAYASAPSVDMKALRADVEELVEAGHGPLLVRLAWHCSGTYSAVDKTGGSNGALMRFTPECAHGANAGLDRARNLLAPLKAKYPGISYADLWTMAGAVAVEYMGGPVIPWRGGRVDGESGAACTPDGRLPDADKGTLSATINGLRSVFGRMGFSDKEIVALSGAHCLGRCHPEASGYWGPWSNAETTFSTMYFTELLTNTWTLKKWAGPDQFESTDGKLMMLPSDMALLWDKDFRRYVEAYAKDDVAFFADFAAAFSKLLELGVPAFQRPWWKVWAA